MFGAEIYYRSWVAANGYKWVRYTDLPEPRGQSIGLAPNPHKGYSGHVLTEVHDPSNPASPRQYRAIDPFEGHPALFQEFAAIPWGDVDRIKSFAARYGMLDTTPTLGVPAAELPQGVNIRGRRNYVPCDPEESWFEGPAIFRALIRAWEGRGEERAEMFEWREASPGRYWWVFRPAPSDGPQKRERRPGLSARVVYRVWDPPEFVVREGEATPRQDAPADGHGTWGGPGVDKMAAVAEAFIRQEISKGISRADCRLSFYQRADGEDLFRVTPSNLLAALFIQFGRAVAGNKKQRRCRVCPTWFELVPQDKDRKEFCSSACKMRDLRERKKRTAALKAEGYTPAKIADELKTDIVTIRKWLAPPKKKED